MDLSFDHPKLLLLLWLLPVLGGVYLWGFAKKRQALQRFATANLLGTLVPAVSVGRQRIKAILVIAATGFLILALTGPRWGTHWEEVERRGVDTIFVLDVSNSMLAEDVAPNRLERAKLDIRDMLTVLAGDRAGLVTFAGKAVLACPLTINYGAFRLALEDVDTRSSPLAPSYSRVISLTIVDLPEPVAPTSATVSPGATSSDTSRSTFGPSP